MADWQSRRVPLVVLTMLLALGLAACGGDQDSEPAPAEDTASAAAPDTTATPAGGAAASDTTPITVEDAGLETPESVLYEERDDVYLVSNINGTPTDTDDNGFIARISPDGTVEQLRWIDAAASEDVTLNAPKGLALKGDTLFVTDIDAVRACDLTTGAPLTSWQVPGATFLNDLVVDADGTLYVSDSGLNPDFSSSGTDAIYRFEGGRPVAVIADTALHRPNGLAARNGELLVAPFASNQVLRVTAGGDSVETVATLPGGQLDGIVRLDDGSLLVSSWETQTVYRIPVDGAPVAVVEDVTSPADIGYDPQRRRVLIPVFNENRLELRPVR